MNHTPGPWRIAQLPDGNHHIIGVPFDDSVAVTSYPFHGSGAMKANAKLIAMAPQLFDALCRVTHPMADDTDVDHALDLIAQLTEQT